MRHKKINKNSLSGICKPVAQATLEFVFAFIVLALMVYAGVKALQWLGVSLASPVAKHYKGLYGYPYPTGASTDNPTFNPIAQLNNADADSSLPSMKLTYDGQLVGQ